jgi:V/A-type H+/Na+-transporting ATPase subunit C
MKKSYPFSSSMIKYRQLSLVNEEDIQNAANSDTAEAALFALKDKGYAANAPELENIFDFENVIGFELKKAIEFLKDVGPDQDLLSLFLLKYDYLNAKTLLKLDLLGKEFSIKDISKNGTIAFDILRESIADSDYSRLPVEMAQAMRQLDREFAINEDATLIGLVMDKAYSVHVQRLLTGVENEAIQKYFEAYVDFTNILTVIRLKSSGYHTDVLKDALLVGGKFYEQEMIKAYEDTSDTDYVCFLRYGYESVLHRPIEQLKSGQGLFAIEKARDDYLIAVLKSDRFDMFSDAISISYLVAKEREAAAVRLLMVGMLNNISVEDISKRLKQLF